MSRNRSFSFHQKKSAQNVNQEERLPTKEKTRVHSQEELTKITLRTPLRGPFFGSTPVIPKLLVDLEENKVFKLQKQRNRRSKSIDFLITKPLSLLPESDDTIHEKKYHTQQKRRSSFSVSILHITFFICI